MVFLSLPSGSRQFHKEVTNSEISFQIICRSLTYKKTNNNSNKWNLIKGKKSCFSFVTTCDCSFTFVQLYPTNRSSYIPLEKPITRSSFHKNNAAAVLKIYLKSPCSRSFSMNFLKYFKTTAQVSIWSLFFIVLNQQLGISWGTRSTTAVVQILRAKWLQVSRAKWLLLLKLNNM